ncbi:MAG TPA: cytochrome o ubiquinol oxidase subunit IV [Candidatus Paceibacterota bacterium]|nr:cytochrome o ubiquinol oxidase subunit IV [Candidatus Paceibacterota bacterium]
MKPQHAYITGFILSILLTFVPLGLLWLHGATSHSFPTHQELRFGFVILALAQLCVQLIFFLHIGQERKPRWNLTALVFAVVVVLILVVGTLWIMTNLEHMQMSDIDIFKGENIFPHADTD